MQLSFWGIVLLVIYTLCALVIYFLYGAHYSVGRAEGWEQDRYSLVKARDETVDLPGNDTIMT